MFRNLTVPIKSLFVLFMSGVLHPAYAQHIQPQSLSGLTICSSGQYVKQIAVIYKKYSSSPATVFTLSDGVTYSIPTTRNDLSSDKFEDYHHFVDTAYTNLTTSYMTHAPVVIYCSGDIVNGVELYGN